MSAESPSLGHVVACLDGLYDPNWAESWDAVGLVCGDPDAPVRRILFAIDPVAGVVDEALAWGAELVVAHHPLFFRPVQGVAATAPKGRSLHRLVAHGVALHVAHSNADVAAPGVSDALSAVLGVRDLQPLQPQPSDPLDKLVTFVPTAEAETLLDALAAAGAGAIGDYERCAWSTDGRGTFRPRPGARPAIGTIDVVQQVRETRLEMVLPRPLRADVVAALRTAHPYEEPAFDLVELAAPPGPRGLGRVGVLESAQHLGAFAAHVAAVLPWAAAGVRVAGDPARRVRTVAVCGGAGDNLLRAAAAAGADAFVTADLRHHPASEASEGDAAGSLPPALVDVAHWASEWPWLPVAASRLEAALAEQGATVETRVSTLCTDPWSLHAPSAIDAGSPH